MTTALYRSRTPVTGEELMAELTRRGLFKTAGVTAAATGTAAAAVAVAGPVSGLLSGSARAATMAELHWAWRKYQLPSAAENIGEVYDGLVQGMRRQGWAGVQHQQDVHGYKPGIDLFAAVEFLYIGGRSFWEVIAVGAGTGTAAQAQQEIQQLQNIVASLTFL